jgi:translocation and assembly module TamB
MTNSPEPESENRSRRRFLTRQRAIAASVLVLAGVGGGALWGWLWIHRELVPLVEQNMNQLLGRPALGHQRCRPPQPIPIGQPPRQ